MIRCFVRIAHAVAGGRWIPYSAAQVHLHHLALITCVFVGLGAATAPFWLPAAPAIPMPEGAFAQPWPPYPGEGIGLGGITPAVALSPIPAGIGSQPLPTGWNAGRSSLSPVAGSVPDVIAPPILAIPTPPTGFSPSVPSSPGRPIEDVPEPGSLWLLLAPAAFLVCRRWLS